MKHLILCSLAFIAFGAQAQDLQTLEDRMNILSEEVSQLKQSKSTQRVHLGGYGEIVYSNARSERENKTKANHSNNPQVDAKRFILYVGYDFDSKWSLTSEIEVEHADEIFLEQGKINYNGGEFFNWHTGVVLIPVGIINPTHEPTTFFSVERTEIESKIIPSTWREVGTGVFGKAGNLSYELDLVTGLKASGFSNDGVRSGRQKASKAEARDLAWVLRLDYNILPSLTVGVSTYLGKAGGTATDVKQTLHELHFVGNMAGVTLKGLYVMQKLDGTTALNNELGKTGSDAVGSEMGGYYLDLGYNVLHGRKDWELTPFARYESYNTQEKVESGFTKDPSKERTNTVFGLNIKPNPKLVFKADYTMAENKAKTGFDTWRLGVGWNF